MQTGGFAGRIAGGAILAVALALAAEAASPAPIYLLASQPGKPAYDGGRGGGPPFSVALAELLGSSAAQLRNAPPGDRRSDRAQMQAALESFAQQSSQADVAVLYATGHGVEFQEAIYLLPGDFSLGSSRLEDRGIRLSHLAGALKARKLNLVFYGGCREGLDSSGN